MYMLKIISIINIKISFILHIYNVQKKIIAMTHMQQMEHICNIYILLIHLMFATTNIIRQNKDYIIIILNKKV